MLREVLINTIFLLFVFVTTNILLTKFFYKLFYKKGYRLFIVPGIIIHEISHIIACLLTGAKIKKFSFFTKKGGYVQHQPSKIPIFGQFFISFTPVLGGIGGILLLLWLFQYWHFFDQGITLHLDFWDDIKTLLFSTLYFLKYNWQTWQFWLFTYLVVSISVCLMPSYQDIKNGIKGLLMIIVLIIIIYYFNLFPDFFIKGLNKLNIILIFGIISQFFGLFFILLFYLFKKFFLLIYENKTY